MSKNSQLRCIMCLEYVLNVAGRRSCVNDLHTILTTDCSLNDFLLIPFVNKDGRAAAAYSKLGILHLYENGGIFLVLKDDLKKLCIEVR